jgi:hypothetical protein
MQIDAMLHAAVLRRFVSFKLPKESADKFISYLTEMHILRNFKHTKSVMRLPRHTCVQLLLNEGVIN